MPHKTPSLMKSVSCYNPRRNSCCTAYRHGAPHNRADPLQIPSFAFVIRCRYFRCRGQPWELCLYAHTFPLVRNIVGYLLVYSIQDSFLICQYTDLLKHRDRHCVYYPNTVLRSALYTHVSVGKDAMLYFLTARIDRCKVKLRSEKRIRGWRSAEWQLSDIPANYKKSIGKSP